MRMNIFSCLFVFVLGCNVTAEISHQVSEEKKVVSLHCPQSVEGEVTWSRERNGQKVDLLTINGDGEKRYNDPGKRFGSSTDKSLHIHRVNVSDTGRYFCNDEPAVDLTVIPSGTDRLDVTEGASALLTCRHDAGGSDVPSWSRDGGEIDQRRVSRGEKTLIVRDVRPDDSGLYYCDGKAAGYLNVNKDQMTERGTMAPTPPPPPPPPTTMPTPALTATPTPTRRQTAATSKTTKKPRKNKTTPYLWQTVRTVTGILYLIIMTSITVTVWTKAGKKQSGHTVETEYVL